jgi:zinc protease
VRKYFGDLPRGAAIVRPRADPVTLSAEKRITFEDRVQVPRLYVSWPSVGDDHRDAPALEFVAQILAGPRTARLTRALVFDQQKAASVGAVNFTGQHVGRFQVTVTPRPGSTLTDLETSVDSIVARLKADGPTANEMARARAGIETAFVQGLQSNLGKAEILNTGLVFHGDAGWYKKNYADLKAVTAADVKRVTSRYLGAGRVVLSIVPQGKPDQASRASASAMVTALPDGSYQMGTK